MSVEQQLSDIELDCGNSNAAAIYDNIRLTASSIYEQYFGKNSQQDIALDQSLTHELFCKIGNRAALPNEFWFDEIRNVLHDKLQVRTNYLIIRSDI